MNSKKAITLLVLATLILSITPLVITNAITVVSVLDEDLLPLGLVVYDDTIIVQGTGATPGRNVNVYWDAIDEWDGESGLLNSTKAEGDGSYEIWFDVPEAVNGDHFISVENVRNGDVDTWGTALTVAARIKLSPSSGLPGDEVTIKGYGFDDEVEIIDVNFDGADIDTSPSTPETDDLGSWTATFDVPSLGYGTYTVDATDENANTDDADFEVGAAITLNKVEGPSGTVVRISGRGFTPGAGIGNGTILLDVVACGVITENAKQIKRKLLLLYNVLTFDVF